MSEREDQKLLGRDQRADDEAHLHRIAREFQAGFDAVERIGRASCRERVCWIV